jgi:N-sulfoglucosamine sulfohydrolase
MTTRRNLLAGAGAAVLSPILAQSARRPNILFAFADDWGAHTTSIGGDPAAKTPIFDRLARSGAHFTNAFVSAPSCSPSRAAILTGQYHWRLGEGANLGGTLPAKYPVYPDLLESAGYHIGFTRKGWAPGEDGPGGRKRNPAGPRYADFAEFLAARPAGAPFCFWFGSSDPHRPYDRDAGLKAGVRLEDVRVPPYLPDHENVRRDIADYISEVQRFDRETGELLDVLAKAGELSNTMVVMSGDNGWPFPRSKATLYDAGTHVPLAISWPDRIKSARRIDSPVSLTDLAPTFLAAAGVGPPAEMTGRSLLPVLTGSGTHRDHVLTGMERHVPSRGEIRGGYPMRAIRTRDHLYIRNFAPDRWPAGDPNGLEDHAAQPFSFDELSNKTFVALADIDSGLSKAHLVTHRSDPKVGRLYHMAAGKRPKAELYDIRKDPYQMTNLAAEPAHAAMLKQMDARLMSELHATNDPRAQGGGDEFDRYIWYQGQPKEQK